MDSNVYRDDVLWGILTLPGITMWNVRKNSHIKSN